MGKNSCQTATCLHVKMINVECGTNRVKVIVKLKLTYPGVKLKVEFLIVKLNLTCSSDKTKGMGQTYFKV